MAVTAEAAVGAEAVTADEGQQGDTRLALRFSALEGIPLNFEGALVQVAVTPEERWTVATVLAWTPDGGAFCAVPAEAASGAGAATVVLDLVYPEAEEGPAIVGYPPTAAAGWARYPSEVMETNAEEAPFGASVANWGHRYALPTADSILANMPDGYLSSML